MSLPDGSFGIRIGQDIHTGEDVFWGQADVRYGGYLTVAARGGKTTLMSRVAHELTTHGSPAIIIDDAGELWNQLQRSVVFFGYQLNRQMIAAGLTAAERDAVIRHRITDRYSFAFLGTGSPNHVRLDILKRRQLPGRRETIEEVVSGNLRPFEARFKDIDIRTRFLSVIGPCLAALVAAQRPITEAWDLLLDPQHWWFVRNEIKRLRVLDDPVSREYLVPQMRHLRRILDLRIRVTKNGPVEAEPYPQMFREKVESTLHAIEVYTPGTVSSRMFVEDSFSPEDVVFGQSVFALTSDVGSELNRNLGITTIYTLFERLLKYRVPGLPNSAYRLFLFLDEVRWFYESITRFFSVANNHRVSTWVLNQQQEQWAQLGMPALASILPKLLSGVRLRDAAESREIADEMALAAETYDPVGLQHRLETEVRTDGESEDESQSENTSDSVSESEGDQHGTAARYAFSGSTTKRSGNGSSWAERGVDLKFSHDLGDADSTGWSDDTTDSSSFSSTRGKTGTKGRGKSRGTGRSHSTSQVEHIINVGAAEQHLLRMQRETHLPRFTVQQRTPNGVRYIRLAEPEPNGSPELMRRLLAEFAEASAARHTVRERRVPYDPDIVIRSVPPPPAPDPEPERAPESEPAPPPAPAPPKPPGRKPSFARDKRAKGRAR
jgi:hypothetical protein